jgi:hypothetical protein
MALLNEGIHSNYYAYKLLIKYFIIYSIYKEVYHHYFTYKHLGLPVHPSAEKEFKEQYPVHYGLIEHLRRVRNATWNYIAPAIVSGSLCFNWLRYTKEKVQFPLRILKTLHYSALTSSLVVLAPFYYTYEFHANRKLCFDITQNYHKFMMDRVDKNWPTYIGYTNYFKLSPRAGFRR